MKTEICPCCGCKLLPDTGSIVFDLRDRPREIMFCPRCNWDDAPFSGSEIDD